MQSKYTIPLTLLVALACCSAMLAQGPGGAAAAPRNFPGAGLFNAEPPFLTGVVLGHSDGVYVEGEKLSVQFMSERDAHLYLLYHQADGRTLLLFPHEAQPKSLLAGKKAVVLPPAEQEVRFRIGPPFGSEVLQAVASLQPLAELEALVKKTGSLASVEPALLEQLQKRLAADRSTWTEHRAELRTIAKTAERPKHEPARMGLFIGIGQYQHPELAPTHEELGHSAEVMHELLLKHGKLDPQRTKLVLNQQASRANIEQLIVRWLPSVSAPGDIVFIYFSGHAGQLDTRDPSEPDGKDETIAPYDLNAGPAEWPLARRLARVRESEIIDDTLARWLQELNGRQLVLIFDTCHSGGLMHAKSASPVNWDDEVKRVKDISQMNVLMLASCAADEQSMFEGLQRKTMWFTHCLAEAIERPEVKKPLSVQAAFDYSRQRMKQLLREGNAGREQEPQMMDHVLLPVMLVE